MLKIENEEELAQMADDENNIRQDLSLIELANRFAFWKTRAYTIEQIASKFNISKSQAGRIGRISKLHNSIKDKIYELDIKSTHALEQVARVDDVDTQMTLLQNITDGIHLSKIKEKVDLILDVSEKKSKKKTTSTPTNPLDVVMLTKTNKDIKKKYSGLSEELKKKADKILLEIKERQEQLLNLG